MYESMIFAICNYVIIVDHSIASQKLNPKVILQSVGWSKTLYFKINLKKHIYINQWYSNFNPQEVDKTEHVSTHGNLHGQLTFTRILGIDGELDWKAGGETRGQAGAAGTHLTGIMSGLNAEFERTERDIWRIGDD